ncbi:MAG TPA: hypothetical protein DCQ31_13795 [Bacteroidales bacterium]|nr:hypothetical protein [Bacteroidales bacterium]
MNFSLKVYDNYHYMDESETYLTGNYETAEEAVNAAKKIVEEFLLQLLEQGTEPDQLYQIFLNFGEDPMVISTNPNLEAPFFSSTTYAQTYINLLIEKDKFTRMYLE